MAMLAETIDAVIGGDTHLDTHALAMLTPAGTVIAELEIVNDEEGFAEALAWIGEHAPGPRVVVGLEGTRSYGIGLARTASAAGLHVIEVERPKRSVRRGRGKSDPIDARLAARSVLGMDSQSAPQPRADGPREALRILLSARHETATGRTRHANMLHALLLTGTDADRELGRGAFTTAKLTKITRRRGNSSDTIEQAIRRAECRRLAQAITAAHRRLKANKHQLAAIAGQLAPGLLSKHGVGPVSAAQALVSWSHPGRVRSEAAFAALAGTSPLPASSGRTVRHRLNRGGDRDLNRAIHHIVVTRWRCDKRTRAYIARRQAEGKSNAEIRRCLKRYVARELHRALIAEMPPTQPIPLCGD